MADVTSTIKDLSNAEPLSNCDFLVVNQPNAFNAITQQLGDTRRITFENLKNSVVESIHSWDIVSQPYLNEPIIFASAARHRVTIRGGTRLVLGERVFFVHNDVEINIPDKLDTGSISNGKDYYLYLIHGGDGLDIVPSLLKPAPTGLNPADVKLIGGLHTLCANAGTGMTFFMGNSSYPLSHYLNGYAANDILPYTVWCLNHLPESDPEGMFFDPQMGHWVDIYRQSQSGLATKSVFHGGVVQSRQYVDHVEDMLCVNKQLLSDEEFASAAMGSNEQTAVGAWNGNAAATEAAAIQGGAGGRVDTAGRRMISIYGAEEMCGCQWQWLRTTSAGGVDGSIYAQTSTTPTYGWIAPTISAYGPYGQAGNKGSYWGLAGALLAGGHWSLGASCGSRSRAASTSRSSADTYHGGRGRSRPRRVIAY